MNRTPVLNPFDEDERTGKRPVFWLILGLSVLCLCVFFMIMVYLYKPDPQILVSQYFPSPTVTPTRTSTPTATSSPTPTATFTPTPDVLLTSVSQMEPAFKEDFSSNQYKWIPRFDSNTVLIEDGVLHLRSEKTGYIGLSTCTSCPLTSDTFYFQGDVSLQETKSETFGLVFCLKNDSYYTFSIRQTQRNFDLYKHSTQGWENIASRERSLMIKKFPEPNTLGVFFDHGEINLYINNVMVYSYKDNEPYKCSRMGFYVNDGEINMLADNVVVFKILVTPSPTP